MYLEIRNKCVGVGDDELEFGCGYAKPQIVAAHQLTSAGSPYHVRSESVWVFDSC